MTELGLDLDKISWVIRKAREIEAGKEAGEDDHASDRLDGTLPDLSELEEEDSSRQQLEIYLDELNVDEQVGLVALTWLGRGDYAVGEWQAAVTTARARRTGLASRYLTAIPTLGDYLEEGLAAFGMRVGAPLLPETVAKHARLMPIT